MKTKARKKENKKKERAMMKIEPESRPINTMKLGDEQRKRKQKQERKEEKRQAHDEDRAVTLIP